MEAHQEMLKTNKEGWEQAAERFFGRTALPDYGPFAPSEQQLHLFGTLAQKKVLEIGCGSGHSLQYMKNQGAEELWGLDLASKQISAAKALLDEQQAKVTLFESPMEANPGIPLNYFDTVYSIYALGWTVDLKQTLRHIYAYLKPGGTFIFSWEHPIHDRLSYNEDLSAFVFDKPYTVEGPELNAGWHQSVYIYHRKLSTYINALLEMGFKLERVIDDVVFPEQAADVSRWYSTAKAELLPATFIVKARK
ncbi:hypothetical protein GCM10011391_09800 [Pullulanibacillus camelliae]|uniref:Methyltransferase type 11 domain-containing protein n=1 Tax=Pullulanibacillus camelliae TaxID=1707096 RepID=A0A8J2YD88_9BACL|nr:class I SAM-dependent methyltransferase [Pullulanibacillus camelliae]GGE33185.1 hypothetical protein GCM10011391_09800 [Pullulanibacillus camelliae]